jgi:hypothetical protein
MKKIWILIYVHRGSIQEPEIFNKKTDANKRKNELLKDFNPDYDEIEVFEKRIL